MSIWLKKKDINYRNFFYKNELKFISYKYLINNNKVNNKLRCVILVENLLKFPQIYKTKIINYCIITNNSRWVFKKIHYSRQQLKKAATTGLLIGFRKLSW